MCAAEDHRVCLVLLTGCAMPPTPVLMRRGGPPISPDLAIGGPSWPRDRAQSTSKRGWKLGASLTAPGAHSGPISDNFPDFGPCPLSDILTPLPFYFFGFSVTRQTAMPIRTAPRFCLGGCGRFEKLLYGCRDPSRLHVSGPWPVSDTQKM